MREENPAGQTSIDAPMTPDEIRHWAERGYDHGGGGALQRLARTALGLLEDKKSLAFAEQELTH